MAFINIVDLSFSYEGSSDMVFEHVSFRMDTDWRLGFTGRNGRGKTTFMRLLWDFGRREEDRRYEYSGTITAPVGFEYFPYEIMDQERFTLEIAEELLPGSTEPGEIWKIFREFSNLELREDVLYRPFSTLSYGERTKALLALLFLRDDKFLLIDEPTNHLDMRAREILGEYLRKKSGFLLVSHDRRLLDTCTDHTLSINKTNIEIQKGNFSSWWENKRRQDACELAENEKLKKDIGRLKMAARQSGEWADQVEATKIGRKNAEKFSTTGGIDTRAYIGEKSRRMQMRRKNLERRQERAIEEKSALLKNLEEVRDLKLFPVEYRSEQLAEFRDVSIGYGEKMVMGGVRFQICRGDRIALTGRNGCGKSSIIKLLLSCLGSRPGEGAVGFENIVHKSADVTVLTYSGKIDIGSRLVISYVPQDAGFLEGKLTDYAKEKEIDPVLLNALLRKMDFSRTQLEKSMEDFSEGQKKKVLLAASLATQAHLYIWDEPLNYIDVFSRMQIEDLILKYKPTLMFVEHDREFVERISTKTLNCDEFSHFIDS